MIIQDISNTLNSCSINQAAVRIALEALIYASQARPRNTLENIILVNLLIASRSWPTSAQMRTHALQYVLTSLIQAEFFRHRHACGLTVFGNESCIQEIREAIIEDGKTANPELLGWGWLYYHYVCIEYNLSAKEFSRLIRVDERTLRRYQTHGIDRLTHLLIKKELLAHEYIKNLSVIAITYGKSTSRLYKCVV